MKQKIKVGIVGGGFISRVHRMAVALDSRAELVAGCFSSQAEKSRKIGRNLYLDPDRVYGSYREMAEKEGTRQDKIDVVTIATPNYLHYPVAKLFLEQG